MKISLQLSVLILFLLIAAIASQGIGAATLTQQQRVELFAELPNWSGIWEPAAQWSGGLNGRGDFKGPPPVGWVIDKDNYRPEWLAQQESQPVSTAPSTRMICAFGYPALMNNLLMFEILITPEETAMIFSRREIRHIYTDGRSQPTARDLWPTLWGSSVGHWENQQLVIDTISVINGKNPSNFSDQAHFTERMKMVDPDRLQVEITLEDPLALKRPATTIFEYTRVTDFDRMVHDDCQGNERSLVE